MAGGILDRVSWRRWIIGIAAGVASVALLAIFGIPLVYLVFLLAFVPPLCLWYNVTRFIPTTEMVFENAYVLLASIFVIATVPLFFVFGPFIAAGGCAGMSSFYVCGVAAWRRFVSHKREDSSVEPPIQPPGEPPV